MCNTKSISQHNNVGKQLLLLMEPTYSRYSFLASSCRLYPAVKGLLGKTPSVVIIVKPSKMPLTDFHSLKVCSLFSFAYCLVLMKRGACHSKYYIQVLS